MRVPVWKWGWLLFIFISTSAFSQTYKTVGSATQNSCNCYTLTGAVQNQSGSVWNETRMDLKQPFDFKFNVFLGCGNSPGADGIAFILQTQPNSIGRNGSGLGFAGVSPSVGIALDTYQNVASDGGGNDLNDPYYDHISIQSNGNVRHGFDLANPVPASANNDNIEDCNWHVLRITWNPATTELQAFFDGDFRVGATVDLINSVFSSSSSVYWGFSASTGGEVNVQQVCTALNPEFSTAPFATGACIGTPLSITDQSLSFAPVSGYYWDFGDGTSATGQNPPAHNYAAPGIYPVRLAITALDGCKSDTLQKLITIGSLPDASFTVTDACFQASPALSFGQTNIGTSYQWLLNGTELSTAEQPLLTDVAPGRYTLERRVVSDFGCGNDAETKSLLVKPAPVIEASLPADLCIGVGALFSGIQNDNNTIIQKWAWNFGDAQKSSIQNPTHAYSRSGTYNINLWAEGSNGCTSDTVTQTRTVFEAQANAGNDTIALNSVPFLLNGSGNGTPQWTPATGLEHTDILNPTASLTNDQRYELTITTPQGCVAKDNVFIEVFKGSSIYVPTAFSPDGNGRNDIMKPTYAGIKKLHYFSVYNRWGQLVFKTSNLNMGWDGQQADKRAGTNSYVWMLRAEDVAGKVYNLKGTFTLVR